MKNIIESLKWRYSVNNFDTNKKLSEVELNELLESIILAPSSFGLQPWKFIAVTNPEIRAQLQAAGYNQTKISESSHLIVFAVQKNIDEAYVDNFIQSVASTRGISIESLVGLKGMIMGAVVARPVEQKIEWAARQVYIALGVLIATAATMNIDVAPMEGFEPQKFDEILGLGGMGLESKVIASVGFRKSDDPEAEYKKVRFAKDDLVIEVK
jgi:nitroreductase